MITRFCKWSLLSFKAATLLGQERILRKGDEDGEFKLTV